MTWSEQVLDEINCTFRDDFFSALMFNMKLPKTEITYQHQTFCMNTQTGELYVHVTTAVWRYIVPQATDLSARWTFKKHTPVLLLYMSQGRCILLVPSKSFHLCRSSWCRSYLWAEWAGNTSAWMTARYHSKSHVYTFTTSKQHALLWPNLLQVVYW